MQGVFLIVKEEGVGRKGIYKGIEASLAREQLYASRFVMYEPLKKVMGETDPKNTPMSKKYISGAIAGFLCSALANPADLLKTKMQAQPVG